jgi:hypothetical protein
VKIFRSQAELDAEFPNHRLGVAQFFDPAQSHMIFVNGVCVGRLVGDPVVGDPPKQITRPSGTVLSVMEAEEGEG